MLNFHLLIFSTQIEYLRLWPLNKSVRIDATISWLIVSVNQSIYCSCFCFLFFLHSVIGKKTHDTLIIYNILRPWYDVNVPTSPLTMFTECKASKRYICPCFKSIIELIILCLKRQDKFKSNILLRFFLVPTNSLVGGSAESGDDFRWICHYGWYLPYYTF